MAGHNSGTYRYLVKPEESNFNRRQHSPATMIDISLVAASQKDAFRIQLFTQ